jgi:SAM-dependent methyltransferase
VTCSLRLKYITKGLRWLPAGTAGKTRLARRLLGSTLQTTDVSINARGGATFITPSLAEPIAFHLLVDGVYEPTALDFVLNRLTSAAVFFDVGANIGVFTLPAAQKVGAAGRVVAIEPSPRVFPYLQRNVHENTLLNVDLIQCAAIDVKSSEVAFYEAPADHFGMGSMGAQFTRSRYPYLVSPSMALPTSCRFDTST